MGAGSLLALVARQYSLRPVRQHSKSAAAEMAHEMFDYERPSQVSHARLPDDEQPAGAQLQPLRSFHLDLAEHLQRLQLQGAGNAHLNWLLDALASTLSTHSSLQLALTLINAPTSASSAASAAPTFVKHRADEVLSMLDVCTTLKQATDDMDRQLGRLQQALQSVGQALSSDKAPFSSGRLRAAAHRLSACLLPHTNNVLCINSNQSYKPLAEARSSLLLAAKSELHSPPTSDPAAALLSQAVDGALLTSLLVLAATVSSLAPPSPKKCSGTIASACKTIVKYLGAKSAVPAPWAAPLRQLQRDLRQEELSVVGGALFQELQSLHAAATRIHATIATPHSRSNIELTVARQGVESLRKSLRETQACVTMFRMQMASFFQALLALRLALLDC